MNTEEIIKMAKHAGIICFGDIHLTRQELEAFAKLVAAKATDEANARSNTSWTLMCKKMVEDEREACAAKAEQVGQYKNHIGIASAIRARS